MQAWGDHDPPSVDELEAFQVADGILVSVDGRDCPVAYLLLYPLDGRAHVEQVSVHPDHADFRLGSQLLDAADGRADDRRLTGLTLTTLAWCRGTPPFYQRLGSRVLDQAELSGGLLNHRELEAARGLDR